MAIGVGSNRVLQVRDRLLAALEVPDRDEAQKALDQYAELVTGSEVDAGGPMFLTVLLQDRKSLLQATGVLSLEEAMTCYAVLNAWDTAATVEKAAVLISVLRAGTKSRRA